MSEKLYVVRHWRGRLSLGAAFWLSGAFVLLAVGIAGQVVLVAERCFGKSRLGGSLPGLSLLACLIWYAVGVWRSAGRRGSNGERSEWGLVARASLILGLLVMVGASINEGMRIRREVAQRERLTNAKCEFRLFRNDTELALSGGIGTGFAQELERTLREHPRVTVLHVNLARGGLIEEALQAATSVRIRGLTTYVSTACVSACTLVYLAGNRRVLRQSARLGFHSMSTPGLRGPALVEANERVIKYFYSRGVALDFARQALSSLSERSWFPSGIELLRAGVVHRIDDGDAFAVSHTGVLSREQIERSLLEQRLFRVLQAKHPSTYAKLVSSTADALRAGSSNEEIGEAGKRVLKPYFEAELPHAADAAILRFARVMKSELEVLAGGAVETCASFLDGEIEGHPRNVASIFPDGVLLEEHEAMADVLDSAQASAHENAKETRRKLTSLRERVRERLVPPPHVNLMLLPPPRATRCDEMRRFLSAVLSLPPADAALVLRDVFAERHK